MADINIGSDSILTSILTENDRITITKAETEQQIATITVGEFMQKCASMIPTASETANGTMQSTYFSLMINSILTRSSVKALTHEDIDKPSGSAVIGAYQYVPAVGAGTTLDNCISGLFISFGKSVNVVQFFFQQSATRKILYRAATDWITWSPWREIG